LCHLQHKLIGFYNQMKSVYSAVRTGSLNKTVCASSLTREMWRLLIIFMRWRGEFYDPMEKNHFFLYMSNFSHVFMPISLYS